MGDLNRFVARKYVYLISASLERDYRQVFNPITHTRFLYTDIKQISLTYIQELGCVINTRTLSIARLHCMHCTYRAVPLFNSHVTCTRCIFFSIFLLYFHEHFLVVPVPRLGMCACVDSKTVNKVNPTSGPTCTRTAVERARCAALFIVSPYKISLVTRPYIRSTQSCQPLFAVFE